LYDMGHHIDARPGVLGSEHHYPRSGRTPFPPRPEKAILIQDDGDARLPETPPQPADWRDEIFAALKAADIRQVGYVPDAGHSRLIELCEADPAIRTVRLTSEEEGIGLAAGAWLGGQRAALLMQSSGVGNCVNLLSLAKSCRFPLTILVTMRGEWGEFNPWQVPMGTKTQEALELMDVLVYRIERAEEAGETVTAALDIAFNGDLATAVLLSQRLIGAKRWVK
jgi:sulfopyruvate decarboxylase alpha subunit